MALFRRALCLGLCALLAAAALPARADGLEALEAFLRSARTGRAEFTQAVTGPVREGQPARTKASSGTFEFQRPSRFRFTYRKPFEQTIVADGQTLWLHDPDLNQVTARRQAQVLASTPAALIATAADLAALRQDFELAAAPDQGGLQWVQATPRAKDGQLRSVRVGFRGPELAALEILDAFGQRSVMSFSRVEVNPALPESTFQFRPPAGADVIRQ
ncbi:outer membrane lipoprotein chaperone LolA [Ramlibacter sp. MAHUQ-53]|uniref:outer membrane lipoprotein chaperone LolA n=1 Tax=unclassified Ramlibacter TaxID=2617605 RepID=UPI00362FE6D8